MNTRYFDHNATTPLCAAARDAWLETAERFWHNPSSLYPDAGAAKLRLEDAREALADLLGVDEPEQIVFTSGATETNNAAIGPAGVCAISATEHPSVQAPARRLAEAPRCIPVDAQGRCDLDALREILVRGNVSLVAVMAANNETGTIQSSAAIAELAREHGALALCDATQWFGKLETTDLARFGDIVVGSAHKFGGPKGVGFALLSDRALPTIGFQTGGPQEARQRAGTEDLPAISAMVAALASADLDAMTAQAAMRDSFERELAKQIAGTSPLSADAKRIPNTSMVVMPSGKNLKWLTRLGRRGFALSTGSACSSGAESGSHVLAAMGISDAEIDRALRISSGAETSQADWDALIGAMVEVAAELGDGKPTIDLGSL